MTLKSEQKVALQLAAKGFQPDIIAEILKVNVRSVQRWLSKHKKLTADSDNSEPTITVDDPVRVTTEIPLEQFAESVSLHQKAVELFQSGIQPDVISEQLQVPGRTIERWLSSGNSPEQTQKLISNYPQEIQSAIVSKIPTPHWVDDVEQVLHEHQKSHEGIRRKLAVILHSELDNPEVNYRAVHIVSQALIRHAAAEREALNVAWVDVNRAIVLLQAYGLTAINLSEIEMLKQQRQQKFPS